MGGNLQSSVGPSPHPIIFYDGVCGLCNRLVQFVLRHDRNGIFRFAALQNSLATQTLARHGIQSTDLDTVYVVVDPGHPDEKLLARSDANIFIARQLGGIWLLLGAVFGAFPQSVRDWAYRAVARRRYRIFGHFDACPLPSPETRERFLDI